MLVDSHAGGCHPTQRGITLHLIQPDFAANRLVALARRALGLEGGNGHLFLSEKSRLNSYRKCERDVAFV